MPNGPLTSSMRVTDECFETGRDSDTSTGAGVKRDGWRRCGLLIISLVLICIDVEEWWWWGNYVLFYVLLKAWPNARKTSYLWVQLFNPPQQKNISKPVSVLENLPDLVLQMWRHGWILCPHMGIQFQLSAYQCNARAPNEWPIRRDNTKSQGIPQRWNRTIQSSPL